MEKLESMETVWIKAEPCEESSHEPQDAGANDYFTEDRDKHRENHIVKQEPLEDIEQPSELHSGTDPGFGSEMSSESSDENDPHSPNTKVAVEAEQFIENRLSTKSRNAYGRKYEKFMKWKTEKQVNSFSESVFMDYFRELSEKHVPSTLWSIYSMLKLTMQINHGVNMKTYKNLTMFLKTFSSGMKPKKAQVFTAEEIEKFLKDAPDEKYLATKVALIFGISGECRGTELANITVEDVETYLKLQVMNILHSKTNKKRSVVNEQHLKVIKAYQKMRPNNAATNRFFLNYQSGRCTNQVIGKNKFANMPRDIAAYLNLPNPEQYKGSCFRRTSASLLADSDGDSPSTRWAPVNSDIKDGLRATPEGGLRLSREMSADENEPLSPETKTEVEAEPLVENNSPEKSRNAYERTYQNFMKWKTEKHVNSFSESVFLDYFREISKKHLPSTLWSIYSMLKSKMQTNHGVNMKSYKKLSFFLTMFSSGIKPKKSKVFTAEEIEKFLKDAPDEKYLATKVALIFGISGACKGTELANITVEDVETGLKLQAMNIPHSKTNKKRRFVVNEQHLKVIKAYQKLRPNNAATNRFFLNYQSGRCTNQVIGKNKFANMPRDIAAYLNLPNAEQYKGNSFRRTSATLLADSVCIKEEPELSCEEAVYVKEEPVTTAPCGVSQAAMLAGLYTDHVVKDELVRGPELPYLPTKPFK